MKEENRGESIQGTQPLNVDSDQFWATVGKTLISDTIETLDGRAQFMITTIAGLITANFGIVTLSGKTGTVFFVPQLPLFVSIAAFVWSLFPRLYTMNPWIPEETRLTFTAIANKKRRCHLVGFLFLLLGLGAIALSILFIPPPTNC